MQVPHYHYVRLHRRHGTAERFLPQQELQVSCRIWAWTAWAAWAASVAFQDCDVGSRDKGGSWVDRLCRINLILKPSSTGCGRGCSSSIFFACLLASQAWARRLENMAAQIQGPLYFLWGTDWEDAPVANARWAVFHAFKTALCCFTGPIT